MTTAAARDTPELLAVTLRVNGREHALSLDPRVSLLDAFRDHLGLTGSTKGCNRGHCGACTVLVDGRRIYSCLALAVAHEGCHIATMENPAPDAASAPTADRTHGPIIRDVVLCPNVLDRVRALAASHDDS